MKLVAVLLTFIGGGVCQYGGAPAGRPQPPAYRREIVSEWSGPLVGYQASRIVNNRQIYDENAWLGSHQEYPRQLEPQQRSYERRISTTGQFGRGAGGSLSLGSAARALSGFGKLHEFSKNK